MKQTTGPGMLTMTSENLKTSFFLSDLHLFSGRSNADKILDELRQKTKEAHTIVLGGDIFDFKWSTHATFDESLRAAFAWLNLLADAGNCELHFILGNHDAHPEFVKGLERIAADRPHFSWHRYFLRLEHCFFLHGDIADGELNHDQLDARRDKISRVTEKPAILHSMYKAAVNARLHRLAISLAIDEQKILRRIAAYADETGNGVAEGVRDVFFGHIHRELDGVEFAGLSFHNGGAAIKGLDFRIIETTLPERPVSHF